MSKASQQQRTSPRDRASGTSRPKQASKADGHETKTATKDAQNPAALEPTVRDEAAITSASEEDDFFARGDMTASLAPSAIDVLVGPELEDAPQSRPLSPAEIERRARLRRIVGSVVGAAALLTGVVGAKALSAPAKRVSSSDGSLNVPHRVVPSIALAAAEQPTSPRANAAPPEQAPAESAEPTPNPGPEAVAAAANSAPEEGAAEPSAPGTAESPANAPAARRLPIIDIEIPASTDPAIDQQWESAAKNLSSQDFKGADSAFAELGKRADPVTRETARLARAVWWTANGRQNEVKPVIADLAANATTPHVRQRARDLLRTN